MALLVLLYYWVYWHYRKCI